MLLILLYYLGIFAFVALLIYVYYQYEKFRSYNYAGGKFRQKRIQEARARAIFGEKLISKKYCIECCQKCGTTLPDKPITLKVMKNTKYLFFSFDCWFPYGSCYYHSEISNALAGEVFDLTKDSGKVIGLTANQSMQYYDELDALLDKKDYTYLDKDRLHYALSREDLMKDSKLIFHTNKHSEFEEETWNYCILNS